MIAKCKTCHNVFDFQQQLDAAPLPVPIVTPRTTPPVVHAALPPPRGLEVIEWPDALEMNVNWRHSGKHFLLTFAIFWNVFMLIFTSALIVGGGLFAFLLPALFILLFHGIGIYMLHQSLGYVFNITNIYVDEKYLAIEHRPFDFLAQKNKYIDTADVQQLYVEQYHQGTQNNTPVLVYRLRLRQRNGNTTLLLDNVRSAAYAKYVEGLIERYLGIEDRSMPGEHY